jgi:hypothetical protein
MTALTEIFVPKFGRPDPSAPSGLQFGDPAYQERWERYYADIGAGWYLDRFVYLFGPDAARLERCLDAWSFLVPPRNPDRMILGRNAYGAILVMEHGNDPVPAVHVLEPYVVTYWTHPYLDFVSLLGTFLPEGKIPHFMDTRLYKKWRKQARAHLQGDDILAPREPEGLGGTRTLENFQVEDIFAYYESTATVYAKAFAKKT